MSTSTADRRLLAVLAFVCALAFAAPAQAQQVTPPRLTTDSRAVYPDAAIRDHVTGSVTVILVLDIDSTGAVSKAIVNEPQGHGFDEAAAQAAARLRFSPAERDGEPVASRIRFTYTFTPPPTQLTGRVAAIDTDRPIAGAVVNVRDSKGEEHVVAIGEDGTWSIPDLPSGAAHVRVTAPGRVSAESDEELASGQETSVVLRLAPIAIAPSPPDAGAPADIPEEATVRGDRPPREVTRRTLAREEIDHLPGTNGDALLSLQNLPGVARPPPLSGALIVRGSAPQDTNVYVDGTNIPLIYHFGGLSSVVPTELLQKIDFYPGNFSAQYGRGQGGIVDVGLRDPQKDALHGFAQLDLIDARVLAEGPILNSGWTFLVAGRRSWFDLWLGPVLSKTSAGVTTAPRYYDYQVMIQKDIDSHSSLRLLFLGSDDALAILNQTPNATNPTLGGDISFHTSFWRLQARYENKIGDATVFRTTAAFGSAVAKGGVGTNELDVTAAPFSLRTELSQRIRDVVTANIGIDAIYEPYTLSLQLPAPTTPGAPSGGPGQLRVQSSSSSTLFLPGAYAELEIVPASRTRIVPGIRGDYDSATHSWDVSPRINARQELTHGFPRTTLKGGAGVFDQPPQPFDVAPNYGQSGLTSNRSTHYDLGVEQDFTRRVDLSLDGFYKSFTNQVVVGSGNSGSGDAYGVELLLRYKPTDRFFGWVSYTLSRSERRDAANQPLYLFQYDQTHVLTVLGSYKPGRGWQVGARFRLVSGDLYTPTIGGAYDATVGSQLGAAAVPPYGTRLPPFYQLDIRVDKKWSFTKWALTAYLDIQNVLSTRNAEGEAYNYNYTSSGHVTGLPILPSFGLRAEL